MFIPTVIEFLTKQAKGCSFWTKLIKYDRNDNSNIQIRHQKWQNVMNIQNVSIDWKKFYKLNHSIKFENNYKFFHYQMIRYNLFTKRYSVNFRDPDDICTFCGLEPEKMIHLMFQCPNVQAFISNVRNSINRLFYDFDNEYLNNPLKLLLGQGEKNADTKNFILGINIARFTWISKCKNEAPNIDGFKRFFSAFVRKQKYVGKLSSLDNVNHNNIWL